MAISVADWAQATSIASSAPSPVLACHIGPDGDALGSMLAFAMGLRARGATPVPSFSEPFSVPRQYSFLPGQELLVPPDQIDPEPDVMITFDVGAFDRLGTLEPPARAARTLLVLDHHVSTEDFGTVKLIDPGVAATAMIARELLARLEVPLTTDIATCLYTGLMTDTGQFQYRNTTPEVHHLAAELVAAGAPQDDIARIIYSTHPVGYLRVAAHALDRLTVTDRMVWTYITQEDLAEAAVGLGDTDGLIDLVRTAEGIDVALVLKQQSDGTYKASMRSKGSTNVGAVCAAFDGGGHALAAGFSSGKTDPASVAADVEATLGTSLPPP